MKNFDKAWDKLNNINKQEVLSEGRHPEADNLSVRRLASLLRGEPEFKKNFEYLWNYKFEYVGKGNQFREGKSASEYYDNCIEDYVAASFNSEFLPHYYLDSLTTIEKTDKDTFIKVARFLLNWLFITVLFDKWLAANAAKSNNTFLLAEAGDGAPYEVIPESDPIGHNLTFGAKDPNFYYRGQNNLFLAIKLTLIPNTDLLTCKLSELASTAKFKLTCNLRNLSPKDPMAMRLAKEPFEAEITFKEFNTTISEILKSVEKDLTDNKTTFWRIVLPEFAAYRCKDVSKDEVLRDFADVAKFYSRANGTLERLRISSKAVKDLLLTPIQEKIDKGQWQIDANGDHVIDVGVTQQDLIDYTRDNNLHYVYVR